MSAISYSGGRKVDSLRLFKDGKLPLYYYVYQLIEKLYEAQVRGVLKVFFYKPTSVVPKSVKKSSTHRLFIL